MADEEKTGNTVVELKRYLATPDMPVDMAEFNEFWKSCTDEEKAEFRAAELPDRALNL